MQFSIIELSQWQSDYFRLPIELQVYIFKLSLISSERIMNPSSPNVPVIQDDHRLRTRPPLGIAFRATCQRACKELPIGAIFSNDFAFTSPMAVDAFVTSVAPRRLDMITSLTISLRRTTLARQVSREDPVPFGYWTHFLSSMPPADPLMRAACRGLPTINDVFPRLRRLRIDMDAISNLLEPRRPNRMRRAFREVVPQYFHSLCPATLDTFEITGTGDEFWKLTGIDRWGPCSEWPCVFVWVHVLDKELISVLKNSIRPNTGGDNWVGLLSDGNRFSFVVRRSEPTPQHMAKMGFTSGSSWEEIIRMTTAGERHGNLVIDVLSS